MFLCSTQNSEYPQVPAVEEDDRDEEQSPVKLSTLPGAKTSDFYTVKNIPERFNNPGMHIRPNIASATHTLYGYRASLLYPCPHYCRIVVPDWLWSWLAFSGTYGRNYRMSFTQQNNYYAKFCLAIEVSH